MGSQTHSTPTSSVGEHSRSSSNGIFVYHLPVEINEIHLTHLFAPFGTITHTSIARDTQTHRSRGFGFVHFQRQDEAQKAIDKMNGQQQLEKECGLRGYV